jgi:translation initiation factor 2D
MFKKSIEVKQRNALKNSIRKEQNLKILTEFNSTQKVQGQLKTKDDVLIYMNDTDPIVYYFDEKIYPTIYLQWSDVDCLKHIETIEQVQKKILNGSNLFVPGIRRYNEFKTDDIVCLTLEGNKAAFAIGIAVINSSEINELSHGTAVQVITYFGDGLSYIATTKQFPMIPNFPIESLELDADTAPQPLEEPNEQLSESEMDQLLTESLLASLNKSLELPVPISNLFEKMKESQVKKLEFKNSSFKKLAKFIKQMTKNNLLETKEMNGVVYVVKFDAAHDLFNQVVIQKTKTKKQPVAPKNTFLINDLYRFPKSGDIKEIQADKDQEFYTAVEIESLLQSYYKKHSLKQNQQVSMSPLLKSVILKKQEKEEIQELNQQEILSRFIQKLSNYHQVVRNGEAGAIEKGKLEQMKVTVKKRGGNKLMTFLTGCEPFGIDPEEFKDLIKKSCGCATSMKKVDTCQYMEIMVQGSMLKKICDSLESIGFPEFKFIGKKQVLQPNPFIVLVGKMP